VPTSTSPPAATPWWERFLAQTGIDVTSCTTGRMQRHRPLSPSEIDQVAARVAHRGPDTS
jgi:hypothetical protein